MQTCHWNAYNTFTIFYLGPLVAAQQVLSGKKRKEGVGTQSLQPSLPEPKTQECQVPQIPPQDIWLPLFSSKCILFIIICLLR